MTSNMFASEAPRYWSANHRVVPLEPGAKRPAKEVVGWQGYLSAIPKEETQADWMRQYAERGIGLLLGAEVAPGLKLAAVDVDDEAFVPFVKAMLKDPVCGKRGKKGATWFVVVPEGENLKASAFHDAEKRGVLDFLYTGKMTVLPPSIHPETGNGYAWLGKPLLDCGVDDLPRVTKKIFDALKFVIGASEVRVLIGGHATHEAALTLTAKLVAAGFDDDAIFAIVRALLPEGYQGDTVDELAGMVASARQKGFDQGNDLGDGMQFDDHVAHVVAEALQPLGYWFGDGFRRYDRGFWRLMEDREIDRATKQALRSLLKPKQMATSYLSRVRNCLQLNLERQDVEFQPTRVCLTNGALNLDTGELEPHAPEHNLRFGLDFAHDPTATCPVWEDQLRATLGGNERAIETFEEFAGLTLVPDMTFQKALYLVGEPASGKSKLLGTVHSLHCADAVSVTPLAHLENERYLTSVVRRLVCISYDTQTDAKVFGESFMRITGGDAVSIRKLYGEVQESVQPTVRFMGSMNYKMPQYIGSAAAIQRRLIMLECPQRVPENEQDKERSARLKGERPGILNRFLMALKRLKERGRFDPPADSAEQVEDYLQSYSPADLFAQEKLDRDPDGAIPIAEIAREYNYWADQVEERHRPAMLLGKDLRALGFRCFSKTVDGRNTRVVAARFKPRISSTAATCPGDFDE